MVSMQFLPILTAAHTIYKSVYSCIYFAADEEAELQNLAYKRQ